MGRGLSGHESLDPSMHTCEGLRSPPPSFSVRSHHLCIRFLLLLLPFGKENRGKCMESKAELDAFQNALHGDSDPDLPEHGIAQVWGAILAAIPTVEAWNVNVRRLVEENGEQFKKFAQLEAAKRGYMWSPTAKGYVLPWSIKACRGKNLIGIGYRAGQIAAVFASEKEGTRRYESVRRDLDRSIVEKLANSPYPDSLYVKLVKNKGIEMQRVVV